MAHAALYPSDKGDAAGTCPDAATHDPSLQVVIRGELGASVDRRPGHFAAQARPGQLRTVPSGSPACDNVLSDPFEAMFPWPIAVIRAAPDASAAVLAGDFGPPRACALYDFFVDQLFMRLWDAAKAG